MDGVEDGDEEEEVEAEEKKVQGMGNSKKGAPIAREEGRLRERKRSVQNGEGPGRAVHRGKGNTTEGPTGADRDHEYLRGREIVGDESSDGEVGGGLAKRKAGNEKTVGKYHGRGKVTAEGGEEAGWGAGREGGDHKAASTMKIRGTDRPEGGRRKGGTHQETALGDGGQDQRKKKRKELRIETLRGKGGNHWDRRVQQLGLRNP